MSGLINQMFIGLLRFSRTLPCIDNDHDPIDCISLNNQQSATQPNLINLHPNEYIEGPQY